MALAQLKALLDEGAPPHCVIADAGDGVETQFRLRLTEIAPGADLDREVLAQLGAPVPVAPDLKTMDARIFRDAPMGLKA
jgi:acyl CoA:acetate/3-ketoacid CoA transferase